MTASLSFPPDDLRASDAEREEAAEVLRTAAEQGRLDVEELSGRLDRVYAAKLHRELAEVVRDLPVAAPAATPAEPVLRPSPGSPLLARARGYLAVGLLLVAIWALTGAGTFWPVWFLVFGLFGVIGHKGGHGSCARRRARGREHGSVYV